MGKCLANGHNLRVAVLWIVGVVLIVLPLQIKAAEIQTGNLVFPNRGLNALQEFNPITRSVVQTLPLPSPYTYSDPPMLETVLIRSSDHGLLINVRDGSGNPALLALTSTGQLVAAQSSGGGWLQQIIFDPLDPTGSTVLGGTPFTSGLKAFNPYTGAANSRITDTGNFIGITNDEAGHIFVGDCGGTGIRLYDSYGVFQGIFSDVLGTTGEDEVNGMTRDSDGNIYVAQNSYNRIVKYTINGNFDGFITNQSFNHPASIYFDPNDGLLYVGNLDGQLTILTTSGTEVGVVNIGGGAIGTASLVPQGSIGSIILSGNVSNTSGSISTTHIYLSWTTSQGVVGIDHYEIYDVNDNLLASTTGTSYEIIGNTTYGYYVKAIDDTGNQLAVSNVLRTYIPPCFYQPFFADFEPNDDQSIAVTGGPRNLVPSPHFYGYIDNSTDEDWYRFYVYEGQTIQQSISVQSTGTQVGWSVKTPGGVFIHEVTNLGTTLPSDQYSYVVPAGGEGYYYFRIWNVNGGNVSTRYEYDIKVTPQSDTIYPSAVTNLQVTRISETEVDLSWTPCTDDYGPIFYGVLNGNTCFFLVATTASSYTVRNLTPNTNYWFYVGAGDAAFNVSFPAGVQVRTLQSPPLDTAPPSAPTNLSWTDITTSSVTLSWNVSSDNVGVAGYHLYNASNAALIATTSNTFFPVTGLAAGGSYSFYVRAYDAANNLSVASNICEVTLPLPNAVSTVPVSSGNSAPVPVQITPPSGTPQTVTVQFPIGNSAGNLQIVAVDTPPASPPSGFTFLGTIYYINTTATYIPPVIVTFPYDPSQVVGSEANLRLFHWENGRWVDVTVSVDALNKTITGQVNSLSPFGIGYPSISFGTYSTGANTNLMSFLALIAISMGIFLLRKRSWNQTS